MSVSISKYTVSYYPMSYPCDMFYTVIMYAIPELKSPSEYIK